MSKHVALAVLVVLSLILVCLKVSGATFLMTFPVVSLVNASSWHWVFVILPACIAWGGVKYTK